MENNYNFADKPKSFADVLRRSIFIALDELPNGDSSKLANVIASKVERLYRVKAEAYWYQEDIMQALVNDSKKELENVLK